jgi:hypothetical protein
LLLLLMTSFFVYFGWTPYLWAGSLGCLALVYLLLPVLPQAQGTNRRIPMVGSRFSPAE